MNEHPILFSGDMVRAILDGRKTQTRRVMKPQPHAGVRLSSFVSSSVEDGHGNEIRCPYGYVGDLLWVRETWKFMPDDAIGYAASPDETCRYHGLVLLGNWRTPIYMPRCASRITLRITEIRAQRIWEISQQDAWDEGCRAYPDDGTGYWDCDPIGMAPLADTPRDEFASLWDSINAKRGYSWESNPWAWVLTFERVEDQG